MVTGVVLRELERALAAGMPHWMPAPCYSGRRRRLAAGRGLRAPSRPARWRVLDLRAAIRILRAEFQTRIGYSAMAKAANIKIKLVSTADTGYFYVTSKNARTKTEKLSYRKYDPVAKKHVEFKETKIK